MATRRKKKFAVLLLSGALSVNLCLPVLATRVPEGGGDHWVDSTTVTDSIALSRSDAYTWVVTELQRISVEITTATSSTADPNAAKVLGLYGSYLVYLNWALNNVSRASSENQWTVLQGPGDFDTATSADLINGAESIRNNINSLGFLSSTTSAVDGTYNSSQAVSSMFPTAEDLLSSDDIFGYQGYYEALQNLMEEYVDGQVLAVMAKHFGTDGSTKEALRTGLAEDFPQEWYTSTIEGNTPADMITVVTAVKSEIIPYLDVYNQVMVTIDTARYRVLAEETITSGETEYSVTPYRYTQDFGDSFTGDVSYITKALYHYLYSATTGESADEEINIDSIDPSAGALSIIAKATMDGTGKVTFDGEPELTTLGYYIIAAGATYDPFVSIAGDEAYISVIEQFIRQSDQQEELLDALRTAVNTRKPIYTTVANGRGDWTDWTDIEQIDSAKYNIATLANLISVNEASLRAYAVPLGVMRPSSVDASTWEYVQGGQSSSDEGETTLEGGLVTVGSEGMLATGEQMSKPIAFTCGSNSLILEGLANNSFVQTVGGLTSLILNNAALDCKGSEVIERADREPIFLNGLGDIVLSDGTVVLPAIANPILYDYSNVPTDSENANSSEGYYPYTATMLNHYPAARVGADKKAYISNANVINKYIISKSSADSIEMTQAVQIYDTLSTSQIKTRITDRLGIATIAVNSFSVEQDVTMVRQPLNFQEASTGNWRQFFGYIFGDNPDYLVYTPQQTSDGIAIFPLQLDNADIMDSYLSIAGPVVTSAVRYISVTDESSSNVRTSSGRLRLESLIEDFIAQGMLGNQYSETFVKNYQMSYEDMVNDQYGRLTILLKDLADSAVDTFGRIAGVLAIKNGYESGFFNVIMDFIQRAYVLIAVVLFIAVAVKFLKGHYSTVYVAMLGLLVFAAFQVYAIWMPTAVPAAYNFFVNDIVENVVWNTVTIKSESYETTYKDSGRVDPQTGEPRPYTATVTLYRMTQAEMDTLAEKLGVDESVIRKGSAVYIDEEAGIFVQGDAIKISIDRLWANNSMRGLYKSQWEEVDSGTEEVDPIDTLSNTNPYIVKLVNSYVSLESYYTPFCQFERAFLVNLNNFSNIFRVDRQTYRYSDSIYKDAFLFNAFTNSAIFTSPDDETGEMLQKNIRTDSILGDMTATVDDIIALCEQHMTPYEDWLNLRDVFDNPSDAMKESLWGQMLVRRGYYNSDWTRTEEQNEKLWELIMYINDQTKQFVIRNSDQLNFCSDENAIKVVSLYATTCFTHRVSEFGYWLYPNYINAADIELRDVLYGAMTSLKDRNTASDGDIVNTVTLNLGFWGAVLVLLITLASALFILIVTYLIPILYALFGIVLVFKLMNSENSMGAVKGYFKVTGVTVLLYLAYSFGLKLVDMFGYAWYGYLGCLVVTLLCLYFLFSVCLSVVTNPLELGNDVLARNMFHALDRLTGGRLGKLTANTLHVHSQAQYSHSFGGARNYMRGASIDERGGRNPRRGEHYGRWSDFDDDSLSGRVRVMSRFGRLGHAGDVGRTRTGFRHTRFMSRMRATSEAAHRAADTAGRARDRVVGAAHSAHAWTAGVRRNIGDRFSNFGRRSGV